jgi:hypothetical protein
MICLLLLLVLPFSSTATDTSALIDGSKIRHLISSFLSWHRCDSYAGRVAFRNPANTRFYNGIDNYSVLALVPSLVATAW